MSIKRTNTLVDPKSLAGASDMQLASWFKPIVLLHPDEEYWPCTVESYLDHCTLRNRAGEIVEAKVNGEVLSRYGVEPVDRELCLDCDESFWKQRPDELNKVPFYVKVDSSDPHVHWLQYWMFYPYNGAFRIGCFTSPTCCPGNKAVVRAGAHQSDWEHISVYVDKRSSKIERLYYSAHGNDDGLWLDSDQVQYSPDHRQRPVVYSAYHSHAHYPQGGCIPRICGCANDFTADKTSILWDPEALVLLEATSPDWQMYIGGVGYPDHNNFPAQKEAWTGEPRTTATFWSRMFRWTGLSCFQAPLA